MLVPCLPHACACHSYIDPPLRIAKGIRKLSRHLFNHQYHVNIDRSTWFHHGLAQYRIAGGTTYNHIILRESTECLLNFSIPLTIICQSLIQFLFLPSGHRLLSMIGQEKGGPQTILLLNDRGYFHTSILVPPSSMFSSGSAPVSLDFLNSGS